MEESRTSYFFRDLLTLKKRIIGAPYSLVGLAANFYVRDHSYITSACFGCFLKKDGIINIVALNVKSYKVNLKVVVKVPKNK